MEWKKCQSAGETCELKIAGEGDPTYLQKVYPHQDWEDGHVRLSLDADMLIPKKHFVSRSSPFSFASSKRRRKVASSMLRTSSSVSRVL
ncbi:hypothetical protein I7I48_06744 [Histoplasma ohiense]|nr:hypothetical protein I7I48_06744 [Histoplasma ohiense (nom. inval.)]